MHKTHTPVPESKLQFKIQAIIGVEWQLDPRSGHGVGETQGICRARLIKPSNRPCGCP